MLTFGFIKSHVSAIFYLRIMNLVKAQLNVQEPLTEIERSQVMISAKTPAIIVIGTGPVGIEFVNELAQRDYDAPVIVYGSEETRPYNRVRLSDYLAGSLYRDALEIEEPESENSYVEYRYNCAVEYVSRSSKNIIDASGRIQQYSKLILATGSSPFIPKIKNSDYPGVYTFRTLAEADELLSRKMRTRHTVVLGGGLLGLETARAMQQYHTRITIVEHNKWLMMQQLDKQGARCLQDFVEESGIHVILGDSVVEVIGNGRVEAIKLRSGIEVACDTLIIAAGIRPNIELARDAGLVVGRGIRVNDYLKTSDDNIYAIGECSEHENIVYGLVKPGFEQAAVLAECITGGTARYKGSFDSTRLKVMSQSVFSAGRTGVDEEAGVSVREYIYQNDSEGIYRKVRLFGNSVVGAVAVGDWHESALIQEAIQSKRKIWLPNLLRFNKTGNVWGDAEDVEVSSWPASAVVCNCTGVTRGRLSNAVNGGCENVACLTATTRAGSVCGSCKPLLAEMLGENTAMEATRSWRGLLALSALALSLAALFIFIWRIPYADSVQHSIRWDLLWRDSLFKQISGFTILGLFACGLLISLRKRLKKFDKGDYDLWRFAHIVLGIGALLALVGHTGFRLGSELNLILMINFLLLAAAGANISTVVATEHRMVPAEAKKQRKRWTWLHLLLFWPLPVLLGFHITKTYYF